MRIGDTKSFFDSLLHDTLKKKKTPERKLLKRVLKNYDKDDEEQLFTADGFWQVGQREALRYFKELATWSLTTIK